MSFSSVRSFELGWLLRGWSGLLLALCLSLSACGKGSGSAPGKGEVAQQRVFRIVRPKQLTALAVLEKKNILADALKPLGVSLKWLEFAAGPQQIEALNAGELDLASTAESPPVFAQAADSPLVYLATQPPSGRATSCLVTPDSGIKTVADLKGKKVAFQKASIGHYLLIKALRQVGLGPSDVQQVFLPPPDAQAAFSEKSVDAWLIWEPFGTRAVKNGSGRVLFDGGGGLRDSGNFYTTSRTFADQNADVLKVFLDELGKTEAWSRAHPREMAELLSADLQIDVPTLLEMHQRYDFAVLPITESVMVKQQQVADLYFGLGYLPKKVDVRLGLLRPEQYAALGLAAPVATP
jgi:sulfonate transport system substrate-binding protein